MDALYGSKTVLQVGGEYQLLPVRPAPRLSTCVATKKDASSTLIASARRVTGNSDHRRYIEECPETAEHALRVDRIAFVYQVP